MLDDDQNSSLPSSDDKFHMVVVVELITSRRNRVRIGSGVLTHLEALLPRHEEPEHRRGQRSPTTPGSRTPRSLFDLVVEEDVSFVLPNLPTHVPLELNFHVFDRLSCHSLPSLRHSPEVDDTQGGW